MRKRGEIITMHSSTAASRIPVELPDVFGDVCLGISQLGGFSFQYLMFTTLNTVIYKNNETVYTNTVKNDNNLDSLMSHLKSLQQNVNEFFTALIGSDVSLNQEKNLTDEESDEADEKFENEDISQIKMSTNLSSQAQIQYIIEWFQEWSEMQRDDFVEILLENCSCVLVNGLLSGIENLGKENSSNRPPSLFQCRIKLFREWSYNWTKQEKEMLVNSIKNMDPKFAEKYEQKLVEKNHIDETLHEH